MITLHTNYGDVLLVDVIYWITVYCSDPYKRCTIRELVHGEVMHKFQCVSNVGNLEEYFYCTISFNKTTEHFCQLKEHSYVVKALLLMLLINLSVTLVSHEWRVLVYCTDTNIIEY